MSTGSLKHPLFARFYTRLSAVMEPEIGEYRSELTEGLAGRVLEVGAGNGMNFSHYGGGVDEVVAIEPEPYLRERAIEAAEAATPRISVIEASATALPFDDDSFDTVVFCLVLCSIDDPAKALSEARRVLKPGGSMRFLEHVRSSKPAKARFQSFLDRSGIWPRMAGGCTCSRDTVAAIRSAGFEITDLKGMPIGPRWSHTNPHVAGRAESPYGV
ncbi:MAG TPA: methyltransferase domain-containing protein [Solirubrobacterales bacterium]|nr:methyltransferase domain-containing protein [Solirubrobacterales bacterium]